MGVCPDYQRNFPRRQKSHSVKLGQHIKRTVIGRTLEVFGSAIVLKWWQICTVFFDRFV